MLGAEPRAELAASRTSATRHGPRRSSAAEAGQGRPAGLGCALGLGCAPLLSRRCHCPPGISSRQLRGSAGPAAAASGGACQRRGRAVPIGAAPLRPRGAAVSLPCPLGGLEDARVLTAGRALQVLPLTITMSNSLSVL